jgi:hypothetical protein
MEKLLAFLMATAALCGAQPQLYPLRAEVVHSQSSATVFANSPGPLDQAITAVREEYGWCVSFEDPPYRHSLDFGANPSVNTRWRASNPGILRYRPGDLSKAHILKGRRCGPRLAGRNRS